MFGLKTHAKLALLHPPRARRGAARSRLVPYAHLGTGNYHPRTTRLYTDFGLLTADPDICADVNEVFLHITSLARAATAEAPAARAVHDAPARAGDDPPRDAQCARTGKPARIIAKMNALVEEGVIRALYAASQAGVEIDLIVRGACALRPGVPGCPRTSACARSSAASSSTIASGISRTTATPDVWLASADWMGRNLFRRIEVAFPVRDPVLRKRVIDEGLRRLSRRQRDAWELRRRRQLDQGEAPRRGAQRAVSAQQATARAAIARCPTAAT